MVCRQSHINVRRVQWVEWMLLTLQRLSALWRKRCCCWPHCDEDTLSSSLPLSRYISTWQRGKQFTVDSRCPWLWNTFCHVREMKKRRSSLWTTLNHMNIVLFPLIAASVAGLFSLTLNSWQLSHSSISIYQIGVVETGPGWVNCDAQRPRKGAR